MNDERRMRRQSVISYLTNCSFHELMIVLREVLPARPEVGTKHISKGWRSQRRFVLCIADRDNRTNPLGRSRRTVWGPWRVSWHLAYPDPAYSDEFGGDPPSGQGGSCATCKVQLVAHVKGGICPLCGGEVGLT